MKLVRTAYVKTTEVYEMEITEQLAQEVEDAIRRELADPATMPHISVQTLIQCWEGSGPDSLKDYRVEVRGYFGTVYKERLDDKVCEYLSEWLWEEDPYQTDSDTVDWDTDLEGVDYDEVDGPNPDFPDEPEEEINHSPESTNDNE